MQCRFVEPVGERFYVSWSEQAPDGHYHRAEREITAAERDESDFNRYRDADLTCETCGEVFHAERASSIGTKQLWSSGLDKLVPGDMYYVTHLHDRETGKCWHAKWENCNDPRGHLHVMLPNGWTWDIDSRAKNCGMPEDNLHRCWIRHSKPPFITVDKNGYTCQAGAGSIQAGDYHGFLINGELRSC